MIASRVLLHLAAALLPLAAAALIMRGNLGSTDSIMFMLAAIAAAQLAASLGWPLFDRAARRGGGWRAAASGVVMALLTHLLFAPLVAVCGLLIGARIFRDPAQFGLMMLWLSVGSLILAGAVTVPAVALLNLALQPLRRKELHRVAV